MISDLNVSGNVGDHAVKKFQTQCKLSHLVLMDMLEKDKPNLQDLMQSQSNKKLVFQLADVINVDEKKMKKKEERSQEAKKGQSKKARVQRPKGKDQVQFMLNDKEKNE